jgi:4-amino-4-deoxy-L-arabinose transferase-like glycosyltransferase
VTKAPLQQSVKASDLPPTNRWRFRASILAVALISLALVSYWPNRTCAANDPDPDCLDYTLPSLNLLHGKGMVHVLDGQKYPPSHPYGLSLLLTPVFALFGGFPGNGVYLICAMALASVALTFFIGRRLFNTRVAVAASIFLIVAGAVREHTIMISSDVPGMFFCLAGYAVVVAALDNERSSPWLWCASGQILGYGMAIRIESIAIVVPALALASATRLIRQERPVVKVALLTLGVLFWGATLLFANYLYTGNCLRGGFQVMNSPLNDRIGGDISWRYLFDSSLGGRTIREILRSGVYQWSLNSGQYPLEKWFYGIADLLCVIGVIKTAKLFRYDWKSRHFLGWVALLLIISLPFYASVFDVFQTRYMLRSIPYLCILNAVGLVTLLDVLGMLRRPMWVLLRRMSIGTHAWLWATVTVLQLRFSIVAAMSVLAIFMLYHPYVSPLANLPLVAYLQHVNSVIPERDAVLISNFSPERAEYILVRDSKRQIIPLHRQMVLDAVVQWNRPPHPEWINEGFQGRTGSNSVFYARCYENGAQNMYPSTALENPEIVEAALEGGRKVYLVSPGVFTGMDEQALAVLRMRHDLRTIENDFERHCTAPQSREFAKGFIFAEVLPKNHAGTRLSFTTNGQVQIEQ